MVYSPVAAGISLLGRLSNTASPLESETVEAQGLAEDLLALADHLARVGQRAEALSHYQSVVEASVPGLPGSAALAERARERRDLLLGVGGGAAERLEILAEQFIDQLLNPVSLAAFGAGAVVRTGVRSGVLAWLGREAGEASLQSSLGRSLLPGLMSFLAEVPAFVGTRRALSGSAGEGVSWGSELAGTGLFLGSLQLGHLAAKPCLTWLAASPALQRFTSGLFQYGAINTGLFLEQKLSDSPHASWEQRAVESFAVLLQLQALGRLTGVLVSGQRPVSAPGPQAWDGRNFQAVLAWQGHGFTGEAGGRAPLSSEVARPGRGFAMVYHQGASGEGDYRLYRDRLSGTPFGEALVDQISAVESGEPDFVPRWLEVFASQPDRGSYEQMLDADALKILYQDRPMETGLGSWEGARMQAFIRKALRDPEFDRGRNALHTLYQTMRAGLSSQKLDHLFGLFRYDLPDPLLISPSEYSAFLSRHRPLIGGLHQAFGDERAGLISDFVFRHAGEDPVRAGQMMEIFLEGKLSTHRSRGLVERAIDGVARHPLRDVAMRRIFLNLATRGLPAKLLELAQPGRSGDGFAHAARWQGEGLDLRAISRKIHSTDQMGFVEDPVVARKMAEVLIAVEPYLNQRAADRSENYRQLWNELSRILDSGTPMTGNALMEILGREEHPQVENLLRDWLTGNFDLELLSPAEFDARVTAWGEVSDCLMFFSRNFDNQGARLVMRRPPRFFRGNSVPGDVDAIDVSQYHGRSQAILELLQRLYGIVHEYRHYIDLSYDGAPPEASRWNRVTSEMMAYLEEFHWRARNTDVVMLEHARRQGVSLGTYLRDRAESSYFIPFDRQVARKYFPEDSP